MKPKYENRIEELVQEHMESVKKAAIKYYHMLPADKQKAIQVDDLLSAGYEGLVKAAGKYHDASDAKFLTYAYKWIDNAIKHELGFYFGNTFLYLDDDGVGKIADTSERIDEVSRTNEEAEVAENNALNAVMTRLMEAGLSEQEITVYCMTNGIGQERLKNLVKIGRTMGISEIQVRRLKQSAERKVRSLTS